MEFGRPSSIVDNLFPKFDPYKHVEIKHFVAMYGTRENVLSRIPFFLEKVIRFHGKR
jgi:hypothetical protein